MTVKLRKKMDFVPQTSAPSICFQGEELGEERQEQNMACVGLEHFVDHKEETWEH